MLLSSGAVLAERFEIESLLGQGGMAEVYLARDLRLGGRICVKLLFPHLRSNPVLRARFEREVVSARELEHPNIVRIYELIEDEKHLFFTMQYVPGSDLKQHIRRSGRLPLPALVEAGAQIASALEAAHEHGIVHRDIKPQNVLLGADGQVKLVDFGLAHMTGLVGLTMGTAVLATPEYSAPEVLSGSVVDPRADLYSFGVLLYEMATGRLPFRGASLYDMVQLHLDAKPPRLREVVPELPAWLEELVSKLLEKDPEDRFQTAGEARQALLRSAAGVAAGPASLARRPEAEPRCPRCQAAMLPFLAVCFECGYEPMVLKQEASGSYQVVLRGRSFFSLQLFRRGDWRDALTYDQKGRLVQLLEELAGAKLEPVRLDRRLRRLPTSAFGGLDQKTARLLSARIEGLGIRARVRHKWSLLHMTAAELQLWAVNLFLLAPFETGTAFALLTLGLVGWHLLRPRLFRPLAELRGTEQFSREAPELAEDCRRVLPRLKSRRLKKLTRKVLGRYAALRELLGTSTDPAFEALRPELPALERLGRQALDLALRIQTLEAALSEVNEPELYEGLQRVEAEFQAETDVERADELGRRRQACAASLERLREGQQTLSRLYGELIRASSGLGSILGRVGAVQGQIEAKDKSLAQLVEEMDEQLGRASSTLQDIGLLP